MTIVITAGQTFFANSTIGDFCINQRIYESFTNLRIIFITFLILTLNYLVNKQKFCYY